MNTTKNELTIGDTVNIDATTENNSKSNTKILWKLTDPNKYQLHVTISSIDSTNESEETDDQVVYMNDLEKRKEAYGVCGECNQPGTGIVWCQPCNAKRFKENFKNWTSGNKNIDELIQQSQLDAVSSVKCLEWVPFEKFQDVTYITRGGFGKIYSANWPERDISCWNSENQEWYRNKYNTKFALKSLDNSSDISTDFLNEIKSHLQFYTENVMKCFGITQDPSTKDYMMILLYFENGSLRNYYLSQEDINYRLKINDLLKIAKGLLDIHNAGKVHKDFHSGNILIGGDNSPFISDLGMCQPANNEKLTVEEGNYGVLSYMAPEVLRGNYYTKASDIYSFGIVMNEYFSEETPYENIPHDHILAVKIRKGHRPKISEDTPKLLADLIMNCWNAKVENRPTAKELCQILKKWVGEIGERKHNNDTGYFDDENNELFDESSEIYSQIKECEEIRKNKLKNSSNENKPENSQTHPQAIYTSRFLSFKYLPEPVNSSENPATNPISECLDCKI